VFERQGAGLFADPWAARDDYYALVSDRSPDSVDAFFSTHARGPQSAGDRERALALLEMPRHRMQMFTSCGWFFADVDGLETTQILQYAARAVELCERATGTTVEARFLSDLEAARAHSRGSKSGREVYERAAASGRELPMSWRNDSRTKSRIPGSVERAAVAAARLPSSAASGGTSGWAGQPNRAACAPCVLRAGRSRCGSRRTNRRRAPRSQLHRCSDSVMVATEKLDHFDHLEIL
jgi:hypothetical protein